MAEFPEPTLGKQLSLNRVRSVQPQEELERQRSNGAWGSQLNEEEPVWAEGDEEEEKWPDEGDGEWPADGDDEWPADGDDNEWPEDEEPPLTSKISTGIGLPPSKSQVKGYRIVELQAFGLDVINKI